MLKVLVAGGLAAMVFGVLFGSVFSREDWIPALWQHPLSAPLVVLAVPLAFGVALLMLGLALTGVQAYWRGAGAHWWRGEAGLLLIYGAAIAAWFWSPGWWLAGIGVVWYLAGCGWRASGELLELVFQLAVNTLSFTRVGAFALAHAGLSSAIVVLAHAASHPLVALAVMLIGNVLVIVLEALVVSIQTTRLILFEFFIRFLKADGRPFRPLPRPPQLLTRRVA
jgi:V/A-type H+-transporting ATPase subunit I